MYISVAANDAAACFFVPGNETGDQQQLRQQQYLKQALKDAGVVVSTAQDPVLPDRSAARSVADSIASSAVFLPVLTDSYMNNLQCLEQLDCALKHGKYHSYPYPSPRVLPMYLKASSSITMPTLQELLQMITAKTTGLSGTTLQHDSEPPLLGRQRRSGRPASAAALQHSGRCHTCSHSQRSPG